MFTHSIVALITPFRNNIIDFVALQNLIEFHIGNGTRGVLVAGSTGEGLLLDQSEREELIKRSVEFANGRIQIIVGCSSCSTKESIALATQAQKLGADGVLIIAPFYVKPTQKGIIQHFTEVHNNSNIPIIMYNNPGRCAVNMSVQAICELAALPRVVALKDSDTNLSRIPFIRESAPQLKLLSGDDPSLVGYLSHGGAGTISVVANIFPRIVSLIIDSWNNSDIKMVQKLNNALTPISEAMFFEANPIPVKYALSKMGFIENELRLPLTNASYETMKKIDNELEVFMQKGLL